MLQISKGFSLIEVIVVVVIMSILAAIAIPNYDHYIQRQRLLHAAEALYSDLNTAHTQASKRGANVYLRFVTTGSDWCYGLSTASGCDCTLAAGVANACELDGVLHTVSSNEFSGVTISANSFTGSEVAFQSSRGLAVGIAPDSSESLTLSNANAQTATVTVHGVGRVSICSNDLSSLSDC